MACHMIRDHPRHPRKIPTLGVVAHSDNLRKSVKSAVKKPGA
jgi:hypothetical protein